MREQSMPKRGFRTYCPAEGVRFVLNFGQKRVKLRVDWPKFGQQNTEGLLNFKCQSANFEMREQCFTYEVWVCQNLLKHCGLMGH